MRLERSQRAFDLLPIKQRIEQMMGEGLTREQAKEMVNRLQRSPYYVWRGYCITHYIGKDADTMVLDPQFLGHCDYITIRNAENTTIRNWRDFWEIKEALCPGREAIEIYPRRSRLVDEANQYHLIVMPEGFTVPFGYPEEHRSVA